MNASGSSLRFRAHRFRGPSFFQEHDELLPPPLPLVKLPEESRLARTGINTRPTHLPVRRHLVATWPLAASSAASSSPVSSPKTLVNGQTEPILSENHVLIEREYEAQNTVDPIDERVRIYDYNHSDLVHTAPADTLGFDSHFESGNLLTADRIFRKSIESSAKPYHEYEFMIHPDVTNSAYRQWFYFEIKHVKPGIEYRFAIINLAKSGALFGNGLQPVVYSEINSKTKNESWVHRGTHVSYASSTSPNSPPGSNTLNFRMEFEHHDDSIFIACLQPYTYTDLVEYLDRLQSDRERSSTFRRMEMCQTLAHNSCELLSITSPSKDGINPEERRVIVLCARVHPGEPNGSWMMKGMIDYLTGNTSGAIVLRNNFIFKIVPMLNPDGVINGNTRVGLAGWDLNRKWANPVEKLFPTIAHLKRLIATFQSRDRVAIFCDLHGHSLHRNVFTYGCYNRRNSRKSSSVGANCITSVKNDPRVFPMIVAKNSNYFSFESCDFKVPKSKYNTARVVVNHELGVINSYTLEASFCGPDFGPRRDTQFSTVDLEEMGQQWCKSLLVYFELLAQVKELEDRRDKKMEMESNGGRSDIEALSNKATTVQRAESPQEQDLLLELPDNLLSDCEAAISELDPLLDVDANEEDEACLESDFSDLEEAIPPSSGPEEEEGGSFPPELITSTRTEELPSEMGQLALEDHGGHDEDEEDDCQDVENLKGHDEYGGIGGYCSTPEEYPESIVHTHVPTKKQKRKIHRTKRCDKKSSKLRRNKHRIKRTTHGAHGRGKKASTKSARVRSTTRHKHDIVVHKKSEICRPSISLPCPTEKTTLPSISVSPRCRRFTPLKVDAEYEEELHQLAVPISPNMKLLKLAERAAEYVQLPGVGVSNSCTNGNVIKRNRDLDAFTQEMSDDSSEEAFESDPESYEPQF